MSREFVRSLSRPAAAVRLREMIQWRLDPWLLGGLVVLMAGGLIVLRGTLGNDDEAFFDQVGHLGLALVLLLVVAQINPRFFRRWAPVIYLVGVVLLLAVLVMGSEAKGARRWLEIPGLPRFQPSEIMKIAVPLMLAWYLHERPLPPRFRHLGIALVLLGAPALLIILEPDLGTGLMVAAGGLAVILLAGIGWRWILAAVVLLLVAVPAVYPMLHDYQKARVLTFLNPERDPMGAGWNIIQSKTAIGSGGFFGKGIENGTQSQLDFLPESQTDFIIAVIGEELGLVGVVLFLLCYLLITARGLYIATQARDTFGRLAAGSLTLVFFTYVFVNVAMVSGLLPIVGVPLPLVSFGGTSALTLLIGFGIVMSVHGHRDW